MSAPPKNAGAPEPTLVALGRPAADPATDGARPWIGPNGQVMRRLELHVTYTCPERCSFCSEAERMELYKQYPVTWSRVVQVLRKHAGRGVQAVHLTGGEPTIHPRFADVLGLARRLGMRTSIGTIGTMLARRDFAERTLPLLDEALFSLHGPDAATHDPLAGRPGSFDTVTAAMRLARELKPDFRMFVNTVMTRHNLDRLGGTLDLATELGAELIVISNTTPEGDALRNYEDLAPRIEELQQHLPPALAGREGGPVLRVFGVPMCLMGQHAMLSNDLHWDPRVTAEWATVPGAVRFEDFYNWAPDRKRLFVPQCEGCSRRGLCTGVYDRYAELWSTEGVRPMV